MGDLLIEWNIILVSTPSVKTSRFCPLRRRLIPRLTIYEALALRTRKRDDKEEQLVTSRIFAELKSRLGEANARSRTYRTASGNQRCITQNLFPRSDEEECFAMN